MWWRRSEKMVLDECLQDVLSTCPLHTVSAGTDCRAERKEKVSSWKFNKYNNILLDQNNSRSCLAISYLKHPLSHHQWQRMTGVLNLDNSKEKPAALLDGSVPQTQIPFWLKQGYAANEDTGRDSGVQVSLFISLHLPWWWCNWLQGQFWTSTWRKSKELK